MMIMSTNVLRGILFGLIISAHVLVNANPPGVMSLLAKTSKFRGLVRKLDSVELKGTLGALKQKTLFAPTNGALLRTLQDIGYAGTNQNNLDDILASYQTLENNKILNLTDAILYHIVGKALTVEKFKKAGSVKTLLVGEALSWNSGSNSIEDGDRTLENAQFLKESSHDLVVKGGFVHGIDRLLISGEFNKTAAASALGVKEPPPRKRSTPPPTPEETKTPSVASTEAATCFPANALVHLSTGQHLEMQHLEASMRVRVSARGLSASSYHYSPVFLFTHKQPSIRAEFIRLTTKSGHSITLTAGHYLYAGGKLRAAGSVGKGDYLTTMAGYSASCYTTAIHPRVARILLAPIRALAHLGISKEPLGGTFFDGAARLVKLIPGGPERM